MPVEERTKLENTHPLKMRFRNLYEKIDLEMIFYSKESRVEFNCDCLKTLGELVQDLVEYCGLKELDS